MVSTVLRLSPQLPIHRVHHPRPQDAQEVLVGEDPVDEITVFGVAVDEGFVEGSPPEASRMTALPAAGVVAKELDQRQRSLALAHCWFQPAGMLGGGELLP